MTEAELKLQADARRRSSTSGSNSDGKMAMKNTSMILRSLRAAMKNSKYVNEPLQAYVVPSEDAHASEYIAASDERRAFVSGFTGSRGLACVTQTEAALWTDGRYFLQAQQQMDSNWELMKEGVGSTPILEAWLAKKLKAGDLVGVDPHLVSAERFMELSKYLKKYSIGLLGVTDNLVDVVWGAEKPAEPSAPIFPLSTTYTGRSWQDKIAAIRKEMAAHGAKLLVLTALDEIAWTFNLRGSDIPYNPVFFSYAIIGLDFVSLFISEEKARPEIRSHLAGAAEQNGELENGGSVEDTVGVYPYSSVLDYLKEYLQQHASKNTDRVWLPLRSCSQAVAGIAPKANRFEYPSPVLEMKAVKNSVELAGMRNAHLKDGVAHCEFLFWLERQMEKVKQGTNVEITELGAALKFEELRQEKEDYVSLSFETISSVGPHAAVIHYGPTPESDAVITPEQIYLVDSGAQYKDGTTDVTRTVCFQPPTDYQRECFTLMLKGHLALAMLKFPEGTSGMRLDTVARTFLWNKGLEFRHGVGHGVGHFLCVHEGPMSVGFRGPNAAKEGIKEGMVVTIEPGYYEDGEFGCRFENVYTVVGAETDYKYQGTKFLGFQPLTLVPVQRHMLDPTLLTPDEVNWLNAYHEECQMELGPLLQEAGKQDVYRWLMEQTRPLG